MPGMITESGTTGLAWWIWYSGMRLSCSRLRAGARALLDHRGERRDRKDLAGHRDFGARVAERLAEDALALTESVHLGGIEQRDPKGERAMHDVAGGARRVRVSVAPFTRAELPGAQTDPADPADAVNVYVLHGAHATGVTGLT